MAKLGLQLYSVRTVTPGNLISVIRDVADMGYQGVEFAGYDGRSAKELAKALSDCGIEAAGSHVGYEQFSGDINAVIDYSLELGLKHVVCPFAMPKKDEETWGDGWKRIADDFNVFGEKLRKAGLIFGYHNHQHEFIPQDGVYGMDVLYENTDHSLVRFQIDCATVEFSGEFKVIDILNKYEPAVELLHYKDLKAVNVHEAITTGDGLVDFKSVSEWGKAHGIPWFVVEYEKKIDDKDLLYADVKRCYDNIIKFM